MKRQSNSNLLNFKKDNLIELNQQSTKEINSGYTWSVTVTIYLYDNSAKVEKGFWDAVGSGVRGGGYNIPSNASI